MPDFDDFKDRNSQHTQDVGILSILAAAPATHRAELVKLRGLQCYDESKQSILQILCGNHLHGVNKATLARVKQIAANLQNRAKKITRNQ